MEEFVTYEIAQKLKEKGFKEECLAYYTTDIDFFYNTTLDSEVVTGFKSFNSNPNSICWKRIDAPTISQVLKWLREEKGLHIEIRFDNRGFGACIDKYDIHTLEHISFNPLLYYGFQKSYEDAAIEGIKYVLDKLI